jgi:hypothetical protein
MADILVAMAQHAQRVEGQETFLRGTMAAHDESNPTLASNAEAQTNKPERIGKEERSDGAKRQFVSVDRIGKGKGKQKAAEQDKPKRKLVRPAFLKTEAVKIVYGEEKDVKFWARLQLEEAVKLIRLNIDALLSASLVVSTTAGPRQGNKGAFRLWNKTIEINNFMVNNEGNEKTMLILEGYLESARTILGGDIPRCKTDVDSTLSDVMGLLTKTHEELEKVKQPVAVDDDLAEPRNRNGISSSKDHLRESDDSNDDERVRKKTKLSRITDGFNKEESDEGKPVRKKMKLRWQRHPRHYQERFQDEGEWQRLQRQFQERFQDEE